ncbi:hypothetical protein SLEP1_g33697 [Rubroshorea leprosula]|uniref:Uncharacterized protein n=1 Tax=Rubroshorea leprosula TaxID=152421 RepID=A0AAV5KHE7_9ROSI|nr:hypothetical protein SLEP1_g33697 [Rubroshorea leprosula]
MNDERVWEFCLSVVRESNSLVAMGKAYAVAETELSFHKRQVFLCKGMR